MFFVAIGVVLIALNLFAIGPVGAWNWNFFGDLWKFCVPFALAVAWWTWTDRSGMDKRREMVRMEKRKQARREENLAALGMSARSRHKRRKHQ